MNGQVVPRRTLRRLTSHEASPTNEPEAAKHSAFNEAIRERWGDSMALGPEESTILPVGEDSMEEGSPDEWHDQFIPYEDEDEEPRHTPEADIVDTTGKSNESVVSS